MFSIFSNSTDALRQHDLYPSSERLRLFRVTSSQQKRKTVKHKNRGNKIVN
jgi:hypothetical protein